jgi:polysaccharide pyruvyl transferase WcaK-like protein/MoaA/NifB/PqqE/SkfB family radical SAM enzyme
MYNKMKSFLPGMWQGAKLVCSSLRDDVRNNWVSRYFPARPTLAQFLVNDICNSHCIMCNIWQREAEVYISRKELGQILSDPLFCEIEQVDISGGEPTLREDLPEIGQLFIDTLPKLKSLQLITNALHPQGVIERATALARLAQTAGIAYCVSVSLDGVGDDHDHNRGVAGNYDSAVEVIKALRQNGVSVVISCTLTPLNCYGADDVLLWCEQNGIRDWTFRLGVDIRRLHNEGYSQRHQFTAEQRFHIIMFFDKLARHRAVDLLRREFYKSLVGQLAFGLPRRAQCNWQARGITLDMAGNISFCPAQSPILGSTLEKGAGKIFRDGIPERKRIIREHCEGCRHDSIGPLTTGQILRRGIDIIAQHYQQKRSSVVKRSYTPKSVLPTDRNSPSEWRHVLITGWYGTETAGDKAILAECLHFLKTYAPGCRVTLTTIDRKISQQTQLELADCHDANLVEMANGHDPSLIESVDAVIIGGGPLMETRQIHCIWRMFVEANRQRRARIVFGCGVGPLHTDRMRQITAAILQMTTAGFLRDQESHEYAVKLAPDTSLGYACDPALGYLQRWLVNNHCGTPYDNAPLRIAGLLRANTNEFIVDQTKPELGDSNARAALKIAQILESVCKTHQVKADLLHMNAPWIGGDDRMFNRRIAGFLSNSGQVRVERAYLPLEGLLRSLHAADAAVAMRYHGHLFCMALGIPFLSIDYTGKPGKVHSLVQRIGYTQWSEEWGSIDSERASGRLQSLLEERAYWSAYLQQQTHRLVTQLNKYYSQVFRVPEILT